MSAVHRDPRYFWPRPNDFEPERWLVNPNDKNPDEFRLNTTAFMPFSYGKAVTVLITPKPQANVHTTTGPTSCVGKNLAIVELRMVVAAVVRKFNIAFAPGWNPENWEENIKDHFLLVTGPLPVVMTRRE